MSRQSPPCSTAAASRQLTTHGTSSACSSSTNPDEDWTKISDLVERRRIQNRIAQRNRRKKLKRRLEDLGTQERSSSVSPYQIQQPGEAVESSKHYKRNPDTRQQQAFPSLIRTRFTPPMQCDDDKLVANNFEGDGSRTPSFTYHTYLAPKAIEYPPYAMPYCPISSSCDWTRAGIDHLVSMAYQGLLTANIRGYKDCTRADVDHLVSMAYQGLLTANIRGYKDLDPHECST